jgi:ligand-binding sensor domain-containing protein
MTPVRGTPPRRTGRGVRSALHRAVRRLVFLGIGSASIGCGLSVHPAGVPDLPADPPGTASVETRPLGLDPNRSLDQFAGTSWGVQEGLPQNSIQAILQTRDGYLWLGTQEGFTRFDGSSFRTFHIGNTPGLPHNNIIALSENPAGGIWVGMRGGGLVLFDGDRASLPEGLPVRPDWSVTALAPDRAGGLWIGTVSQGLGRLQDGAFTAWGVADGLLSEQVTSICVSSDEVVWVGCERGLVRMDPAAGGTFRPVVIFVDLDVQALACDPRGGLWIGTPGGLLRYDGRSRRPVTGADGRGLEAVQTLLQDEFGNLWIGTTRGIARLREGRLDRLEDIGEEMGRIVVALMVDREGDLWFGLAFGGLHQLREGRIVTLGPAQGLRQPVIYAVAPARDGGLWVGGYTGEVDRLREGRFEPVCVVPGTGMGRVRSILETGDGTLWLGNDQGLYRWRRGALSRFVGQGRGGFPAVPVRALGEDTAGALWVGADGIGLYRIGPDGAMTLFDESDGLPSLEFRLIFCDRAGRLWVGTYGGLALLEEGQFRVFGQEQGLSHNYVRTITEADDGTFWIGTYGGGINRFRDGVFTPVTARDGLPSNTIYQTVDDRSGRLWMSCNLGIFYVPLAELDAFAGGRIGRVAPVTFDESDGMRNRECNGGNPAGCRTPDGRLWFPTVDGLALIDSKRILPDAIPPQVVLDAVRVDDVPWDPGREALLPANPRRLEFRFTALDYSAPDKIRIRYLLDGFDADWREVRDVRSVQYTQLRPGKYCFHVVAANGDGVWNRAGALFPFTVRPAFYQMIGFYLLVVLVLFSAGWGFVTWRLSQVRRDEEVLRERVNEALAQVKTLSGLLPICANCKKVRDDRGYWERIEVYVRDRSDAEFSHGLCPDCLKELYPDFAPDSADGPAAGPESGT